MFSLGCKTFKDGVNTAIVFIIAGLCMVLAGSWVIPEIWYLPHAIIGGGLLLLLMAPIILISSYLKNRTSR